MRYATVCSGIEAPSAAWHPLGWAPVFFSEIEAFPSAVLAHRYPHVPNWGDMTRFKEWSLEPVDLICAGTPCQSFSVAGLRKGLDDPRGNLTLVYLAILDRLRPKWMVWENVPGVLSDGTGAFGSFLGGLGELGYGFAYRVLDAQHFGVPQRRRRVFVVGCLGDWRAAAAVLFELHSLQGHPAPSREAGQRVAASVIKGAAIGRKPEAGPQFGEHLSDGSCYTLNCTEQHAVATTLTGYSGRNHVEAQYLPVAHSLRADGFDASEDGTGRGTPLVPVMPFDTTQITSKTDRSQPAYGKLCHTLAKGAHPPSIAFGWQNSSQQGASASVTPTLDKSKVPAIGDLMQVRRLTPVECERLQGFCDNYTLITYRGKPAADGPRYKALGNSMAVPVIRWLGERISAVDEIINGRAAA